MIWINPSSCAKDLTISEVIGVTSIFPFQFKSSYVFPRPFETPKNGQIPFLRNTYKIRHHKKDNGNPTINYFIYEFHSNRNSMNFIVIEIELSFLYTLPGSVAIAGFTQSIGSYRYPFNTKISTQHRSSKGSRRPTKARKPGSFRK